MPATPAQSSAPPARDGHSQLIGVWGGSPQAVPPAFAHSAINRFFREDQNRTRPSIKSCKATFDTEADRIWFEGGNAQGIFLYTGYPSTRPSRIVVSISGKIFIGIVRGRHIHWSVLFDGNSRVMCNTWFAQGFEWLFIQDGINQPILWNGTDAARRSDPGKQEMPIGSVMAFIHGRMAVASADGNNTIKVGDIVYGGNATNHNDIILFTEQEYWAEGGSFDIATNLGDIMGLYPMPWLDTGTGANELVALCTQGFTSFDLSEERTNWLDQQVQKISMIGQGCLSSIGFTGLNGDLFYRRSDGIGSYRNARTEFTRTWRATPVSREVNEFLRYDRTDLLKFIPMVAWQNMVFTGISPQLQAPNNLCAGYHRYCRGMVVLDAQSMSTTSRDGAPVWHGAWTGVRPVGFVQGIVESADRMFCLSFDRDGRNRLYEFSLTDGEDLYENEPRKQFWRYDTAALGQVEARFSFFDLKKVTGGQLVLSGIKSQGDVEVSIFPDGAPCRITLSGGDVGCDCPDYAPCLVGTQPQWENIHLEAPLVEGVASCVPGTTQPGGMMHYCVARIGGHGAMAVERFNIRMQEQKESDTAECLTPNCEPVRCCANEGDFGYHIAPAGVNDEVPDIPCPVPVGPNFTSTRYFTLYCPSMPSIFVMGTGQATSTVSQLDADTQAQAAAQANAEQLLSQSSCPQCEPFVIVGFEADGGDTDLNGYFATGLYEDNIGQPWRLVDSITDELIATGIVGADGTLVTDIPDYGYPHGTYDPVTNIYADNGSGPTTINLQMGCSIGGTNTWPLPQGYGY